jgi:hypothetical protein
MTSRGIEDACRDRFQAITAIQSLGPDVERQYEAYVLELKRELASYYEAGTMPVDVLQRYEARIEDFICLADED